MSNPMDQFKVKTLVPLEAGGVDISFTNASLYMVLAVVFSTLVMTLCLRKRTMIPGYAQSIPESIYDFVIGIVRESAGPEGLKYFSFIFSLFLFVAFGNMLGLTPYAFTFTSQIATVGALSVLALVFNVVVGIKKKKLKYLRTFLPEGIPAVLAVLVVPIEIISMLSKPFSLTIRLVANMTVGHIMLKILASFTVALGIFGFVPLLFNGCIIIFEMFICLLQAFVYTVLSCIYMGEALSGH